MRIGIKSINQVGRGISCKNLEGSVVAESQRGPDPVGTASSRYTDPAGQEFCDCLYSWRSQVTVTDSDGSVVAASSRSPIWQTSILRFPLQWIVTGDGHAFAAARFDSCNSWSIILVVGPPPAANPCDLQPRRSPARTSSTAHKGRFQASMVRPGLPVIADQSRGSWVLRSVQVRQRRMGMSLRCRVFRVLAGRKSPRRVFIHVDENTPVSADRRPVWPGPLRRWERWLR